MLAGQALLLEGVGLTTITGASRAVTNLALRASYERGDRSFDEYDNERGGGAM